ncbi:MAG: family 43 glycosylhydrolase [Methylacidiphilales bacterium]|nr:family 43 glycosylhydrolase [Candidatus Methylacidiphilales bacterium]
MQVKQNGTARGNNWTSKTEPIGGSVNAEVYNYDAVNQVAVVDYGTGQTQNCAYDAGGNRIPRRKPYGQMLAILLFLAQVSGAWATDTLPTFVFSTFPNSDQKLYLFTSSDGKTFAPVAPGPVYSPINGNLRDPSIIRYGGRYYVCHTAGNFGQVNYFSIVSSPDLITWTKLTDVSMASIPGVVYTWAPEWFIDDDGSVHIFASVSPTITSENVIYEMHQQTAGDFTKWSAPVRLTGPAFPEFAPGTFPSGNYDAYVVKRDSTYYIFYFNQCSSYVECASSANLTGPYTPFKTLDWAGIGIYQEGPCMVSLGGSRWRLYYADAIHSYLKYVESGDDWNTWSSPVALNQSPIIANHGTVMLLPGHSDIIPRLSADGPDLHLTFKTESGRQYQIQNSMDLAQWFLVPGKITGDGSDYVFTDANATLTGRKYYRVNRLLQSNELP